MQFLDVLHAIPARTKIHSYFFQTHLRFPIGSLAPTWRRPAGHANGILERWCKNPADMWKTDFTGQDKRVVACCLWISRRAGDPGVMH